MESEREEREKKGRSEQAEAKEVLAVELCPLAQTPQQPTESGTRQTQLPPTQPHVGSSSQVRMLFLVLDVWK